MIKRCVINRTEYLPQPFISPSLVKQPAVHGKYPVAAKFSSHGNPFFRTHLLSIDKQYSNDSLLMFQWALGKYHLQTKVGEKIRKPNALPTLIVAILSRMNSGINLLKIKVFTFSGPTRNENIKFT